jgi:FkbM family methyltransferase
VHPRLAEAVRRARRAVVRREYPIVAAHIGRLDYGSAEIVVGVTSRSEILSRLRPSSKEPWTVRWLERTLRDGDVFYDVGANIGAYSLIAAALERDVRVVAIEPAYANYAALCDNVVLNGRQDVVVPLPVALTERTGLVMLSCSDVAAGAAEHGLGRREEAAFRQAVLAYRLDELLEQFELPPPTMLKVDVDGGEAAVLAGAEKTLARPELRSALLEIDRERGGEVVPLLEAAGLVLAERTEERDGVPLHRVWYGVFGRPDYH